MRIIIVGAGQMGCAAGFELLRRGVEVIYLDNNYSKKDSIPKRSTFIYTEDPCQFISDCSRLDKIDVIIGAAGYHLNEALTRVAIDKKIHFCDLGGNNDVVKKQLALNDEAEAAGIVAVFDCGLAPGLACMLAAKGIEQLGGTADVVNIYVGGLPEIPQPPFNYALSWSVNGLINEYIEKSKILCGDKIIQVESLSDVEKFEFSCDEYEVFHTSGGISTLLETYFGKVKNICYKTIRYPGHANFMMSLKALGMFNEHRNFTEELLNKSLPKIDANNPDYVIVRVEIYNADKKTEFEICEGYDKINNLSAMARTTGFSVANVAYLLGSGTVSRYIKEKLGKSGGVIPGELSLPLDEYIKCVEESGIKIYWTSTEFKTKIKLDDKPKKSWLWKIFTKNT